MTTMKAVRIHHLGAGTLALGVLLPSSLLALPVAALQRDGGQTFNYPPRLV